MNSKKMNKYNYYQIIKNDTKDIFYKYNLKRFIKHKDKEICELLERIYIEKLYNLLLNIANQELYNYNYNFTKDDMEFIIDFEIDKILYDILKILHLRLKEEKDNNEKNPLLLD